LLNFGCIDGSRSLNRSRILKFENFADSDLQRGSTISEQERGRRLKMWLQLQEKMHRAAASSIRGVQKTWTKLSTLLVGLGYLRSPALFWSSTMACMQLFMSMARDTADFRSNVVSRRGASLLPPSLQCSSLHY